MSDLIDRQVAIDYCYALINAENPTDNHDYWNYSQERINQTEVILHYLESMPSAEPVGKKGEWTTEEVAEILASVLGDECACNFNGIDEWLPSACKYADTECPTPKEKHGCWIQFLMQGGADMRGEQDG